MKKKLLALTLSIAMMFGSAMTVLAANETEITESSADQKATITVTANITETYSVRVPKTIALGNDGQYSNANAISVTGNLAGNKQLNLTVPASVDISAAGKDAITGTITTTKKAFTFTELSGGKTVNSGLTITPAAVPTAGNWTGSFDITVALGSTT